MGLLQDLLGARFRRVGKYDAQNLAAEVGLLTPTEAGANINEHTAMSISAVYACVYKIATTMASMPLQIVRQEDRRVIVDPDHPTHTVVAAMPNVDCTSYEFWEGIISHALMYGRGFALVRRNGRGYPESLIPLHSPDVRTKSLDDGRKVYDVQRLGIVMPEDMLVVSNLHGMSPIRLHRENLGLTKSAELYGAEFFGNGGQMTGILSSEQPLKPEQVQTMQTSWNASNTSAGTKLLPFGFKYTPVSVPPEAMTFIETRKFQAEEIARIYNVPPVLIQLEGSTTYNNVEQQNLMFRQSLLPWVNRIQQEVDRKLLPSVDRGRYRSRYDMAALFAADLDTKSKYYQDALQSGWMSINEVRQREGMEPVEGGDEHTIQVNQYALSRLEAFSDKISAPDAVQ